MFSDRILFLSENAASVIEAFCFVVYQKAEKKGHVKTQETNYWPFLGNFSVRIAPLCLHSGYLQVSHSTQFLSNEER